MTVELKDALGAVESYQKLKADVEEFKKCFAENKKKLVQDMAKTNSPYYDP
jgi:hypothetical protein